MKPTLARTVLYILSDNDVTRINAQRQALIDLFGGLVKADQIGRPVKAGDILPMTITHVWDDEIVNGKVLLDGSDQLWAVSSQFDADKRGGGTWHWPEIVKPVVMPLMHSATFREERREIHDTESLARVMHDAFQAHRYATDRGESFEGLLWVAKVNSPAFIEDCQAWRHVASSVSRALS